MPAAAPTAPPAGVTIVGDGPPKPPPAPTSTIRVSQMPSNPEPTPPPAKGSAMDRLRQDLQKKATVAPAAPNPPAATNTPPAAVSPGDEPDNVPPADSPPTPPAADGTPATPPKKQTLGQTLDIYKKKVTTLEAELAAAKTALVPEAERKSIEERIAKAEKRAQELEDHIRYVDYTKSAEFNDKYQKPYEEAWKRAMSELGELTVQDPGSDQPRSMSADDILQLVNLPLGQARALAQQMFGDFADDVMAHRKEIKNLFQAQANALDTAKKAGAERAKQAQEQLERAKGEIQTVIKTNWEKANTAAAEDPKYGRYFKPVEGDQDGNQRLSKGFELVDRAFAENPLAPGLTPEQRAGIVQRHAAVRNRAAAFGRLVQQLSSLETRNAELEKELAEYKGTTPPVSGSRPAGNPVQPKSAWERLRADLAKKATRA